MAYEILETVEAGLSLRGSEVKSLRARLASLDGCFGRHEGGEFFLYNLSLTPVQKHAVTSETPDPRRKRKLLLNKQEMRRLSGKLDIKGWTLVPLEIYFRNGWAKVSLAVAKGKRGPDRRADLKKKDLVREAEKSFKGKFKT